MLHELWVDPEGLDLFCLAGPLGEGARSSLPHGSILEWTVEATSHFDAMTRYYRYREYGEYTTDFPELDKSPYED
jgi:hypothetical protein